MPTVLREGGFVVKLWGPPREHGPPHVHVHKGTEGLIIIRLGSATNQPTIWQYYNVRERDVVRAYRLVHANQDYLNEQWERIHEQE